MRPLGGTWMFPANGPCIDNCIRSVHSFYLSRILLVFATKLIVLQSFLIITSSVIYNNGIKEWQKNGNWNMQVPINIKSSNSINRHAAKTIMKMLFTELRSTGPSAGKTSCIMSSSSWAAQREQRWTPAPLNSTYVTVICFSVAQQNRSSQMHGCPWFGWDSCKIITRQQYSAFCLEMDPDNVCNVNVGPFDDSVSGDPDVPKVSQGPIFLPKNLQPVWSKVV